MGYVCTYKQSSVLNYSCLEVLVYASKDSVLEGLDPLVQVKAHRVVFNYLLLVLGSFLRNSHTIKVRVRVRVRWTRLREASPLRVPYQIGYLNSC